ncbi:MAG: hypothetical protein EOO04_33410 [Chitinophagaceae bacterium]|nr:MAG: hypothetical protein EOO04_33410 [Chitinophagaceae bacterium]
MKSKPIIYLLSFSVLGIWGVILVRLYLSVSDNDDNVLPVAKVLTTPKAKVPKLYPDTFKLLLNYPDPFTGAATAATDTTGASTIRKSPHAVLPVVSEVNPLQEMKYLGYVRDGRGRNNVAIISQNGKERMMKLGDTIGGATLSNIDRKKIAVRYKDRTIIINAE